MSDQLTVDTPVDDDSVDTSVEDGTQSDETAVDDASGQGSEKFVPAARFNGLQSKLQSTLTELSQEREAREALEARFADLESQLTPSLEQEEKHDIPMSETESSQVAALTEQVQALTAMLMEQQGQSVKESILAEFPEVAPFADLINADSAEGYREVAQTLSERIKAATGTDASASADDASSEEVAAPPVGGGGPGAVDDGTPDTDEKASEALSKGDFLGFLAAKREAAVGDGLTL